MVHFHKSKYKSELRAMCKWVLMMSNGKTWPSDIPRDGIDKIIKKPDELLRSKKSTISILENVTNVM